MKFVVRIESQEKHVDIEERNGFYEIVVDGKRHVVDCRDFGHKDYISLLINNKSYLVESAPIKADEGKYYATVMGRHYKLEVFDELLLAARESAGAAGLEQSYTVKAPMPGLIVDVKVKPGDEVEAGTAVVTMEAMKMQNALITEVEGVVHEVYTKPGESVESDAPLVRIERKR